MAKAVHGAQMKHALDGGCCRASIVRHQNENAAMKKDSSSGNDDWALLRPHS